MATRRKVLGTAAGVAAGAATIAIPGTASAAPVRDATVPRTLARRLRPIAGGTRVDRTPFTVSHLVLSWRGGRKPAIRTRSESGWSDWRAVHANHDGKDGMRGRAPEQSAVVVAPSTVGYEIDYASGAATLSVTELNTTSTVAPRRRPAPIPTLEIDGLSTSVRYLKRAAWGANESWMTWDAEYYPVQALTVHHTVTVNNDPDPAATVRAIYYDQAVRQEWGDIGYNFLIDQAGTVYEGRWSGTDSNPGFGPADPSGRPQLVTGGHVYEYNTGNVGVVLLGDFTDQQPTPEARLALTKVLALLADLNGLNPVGIVNYVNPVTNKTKQLEVIAGHRQWMATQCPGNTFYPQLPSLRQDVNNLLLGIERRRTTTPYTWGA